MKKITSLFIFISLPFSFLFGQEDIQKAKEQIANTQAILNDTQYKKDASLSELNDIEAQVEGREHYLNQIKNRIKEAHNEGENAKKSVDSLQQKIKVLKEEYAELVYAAYKTGGDFQQLAYLFSSENFTQFVRRTNYLEHYKDTRKKQIIEIERSQELLENKKIEIEARNDESIALLSEEKQQLDQLKELKIRQSQLVNDLRKKENELISQLNKERNALIELQRQMLALTASVSNNDSFEEDFPVDLEKDSKKEINTDVSIKKFKDTKGQLTWPVNNGVITNRFGTRPHPVLSGVTIENHGIDLRVKENTIVKSVYSGVVTAVTKVPNLQNVIMIRHDNYFTVYSKLNKVLVKVGDIIGENTKIGIAGENLDGFFEVQFQIWNMDGEKLNPEKWLAEKD